jgi:hypothetical protein
MSADMQVTLQPDHNQGNVSPKAVYPGSGVGKIVFPDPDRNPSLAHDHSPIRVKNLNLPPVKKNGIQTSPDQTGGYNSSSKGQKHYSELAR